MTSDIKTDFAARLHEICDDMGLPERGRQSKLAEIAGEGDKKLTPNAARKWLLGEGMPELDRLVRIANWAKVNINWLLQGIPPKRGQRVDVAALEVTEAITELPADDKQQVLDFIRYKFDRSDGWFAAEKLAKYMTLLDRLSQSPPAQPKPKDS